MGGLANIHRQNIAQWAKFQVNRFFILDLSYMVNTNTNNHNGISFLVQMFKKESNLTKNRGEI